MITISPSLLAADFSDLGSELRKIKEAGADMLHLDVMDGHLVPNISFGMPVIAALRKVTDIFFDVHIMISEPQRYIPDLVRAGADLITFHVEANGDPAKTIEMIHSYGIKAGISLSPDTPAEAVLPYLGQADLVLIMTVVPGFGGQSFRSDMMPKLRTISDYIRDNKLSTIVQVDGGVARDTIAECAQNGANSFVAGSAVFGKADYAAEIAALRQLADR